MRSSSAPSRLLGPTGSPTAAANVRLHRASAQTGFDGLSTWLLSGMLALVLAACSPSEQQALLEIQSEQAKADGGKALTLLKLLVSSRPNSAQARWLLGQQLLAQDQASAAVIELQHALDLDLAESRVLPTLADAMIRSGEPQRVIEQFATKVLGEPEASASLQASVALAFLSQGDLTQARSALARGLAAVQMAGKLPAAPGASSATAGTAPSAITGLATASAALQLVSARIAAASGDNDQALAAVESLLATQADNDRAWALKGELLLRLADHPPERRTERQAQATAALKRAVALRPTQAYARATLVSQALANGDIATARSEWAALQKAAPAHPSTGLLAAHLAYAEGQHGRAREIYQSLLRRQPDDLGLLLAAGENELRLGAPVQAEALLAKASALAPQSTLARRLLAQTQLRLGQTGRALVTLAPLIDAADAQPDVLALAALVRQGQGETAAATALWARVASLKPGDPRLRTLLASASLGHGADAQALESLRAIAASDTGTVADLALIQALKQRGQIDAAMQALDRLMLKRPQDAAIHHLRAQLLWLQHDSNGARNSLMQALALAPQHFPAVAALAALDLRALQPEAARARLTALVKAQPGQVEATLALAELARSQGAPRAETRKLIESAIQRSPNHPGARAALVAHHLAGNDPEAALAAAQAAQLALPESLELLSLLGRSQIAANETSQALSSFGKIVSRYPKLALGHLGQAEAFLQSNNLAMAQRSVLKALELAPDQPEVLSLATALALREGKPTEAIALARSLQAQRPAEALGFLQEGEIEISRRDWPAAITALRLAVTKAKPERAAIKLHHALLRDHQPAEARAFAADWIQRGAADAGFLFEQGRLAQNTGDLVLAEGHYRRALALQPDHAWALNNLAMLQIAKNKPEATALAEQAVRAWPDQPALLDTLAQAHAADRSAAKAVELAQHAVALEPQNGTWRMHLAQFHLLAGNKGQAKAELERLAALGTAFTDQEEVRRMLSGLTRSLPGR